MKKTYLSLCLSFLFGISALTSAQTAPADANLKHQWTFDDGTANDSKGTLNGTLEGGATITDKALNTTNGGYVNLSGSDLAINAYTELSMEVWFTSAPGANGSYHMLYYFGNTNAGGGGENYTCITPARGNNVSRAMLSTGTGGSGAENGVNGPEYDDGILHHMVCTINATTIVFYIDGINMGSADLSGTNSLAGIGTQFAYFAKGGYRADPTWKGKIHKISMYDVALTDENVAYLFQKGAEAQPVISSATSSFAFDSNYDAEISTITAANLNNPITITAPAGITVDPKTLPANALNTEIVVSYDGSTVVDGNITLTSGTTVTKIPVKAVSDATCFVPLYTESVNMISDPGLNSLTTFKGWGDKAVVKITTDPTNVFCGASSIRIGDGEKANTGSLDLPLNGMLMPSTTYRVKVVYKTNGRFNLGVERIDGNGTKILKPLEANEQWQVLDFVFTTGETVPDNPVMYINNWPGDGGAGTLAFVDNWEMYIVPDAVVSATKTGLAFDELFTSDNFTVTGNNLSQDIVITAPAGITVQPSTIPAAAVSTPVSVTYNGTTAVNGVISIASGNVTTTVAVKSASNSCFAPIYSDRQNLIPDPYMNDKNNFRGWENWQIISLAESDSIYCGSHCAKITNRGDIEVALTGLLKPRHSYVSKAMVRTIGGAFRMGINGFDKFFSAGIDPSYPKDYIDSINTAGQWKELTFEFSTGDSLNTSQVIFFNNDHQVGKIAYLDNWQLFVKDTISAVNKVSDKFEKLYINNGRIVAEFDADYASHAQLSVYNMQGALIADEKLQATAGHNMKVMNATLPKGIFIVRLTQNGESSYRKLKN
ncbi:MAG: T9SS type A sorting domain-containing protein [Paludibacter sp.]|nr:T9SS type A sorting domain-containing protein [Paludibacter sp.]